jgi:uncharacterized Tic20 family protein
MTEPAPTPSTEISKDARTWGMLCHLLAFSGLVVPFGGILGPLVMWLLKKDVHPFVDDQGKEALNFQITMTIAVVISAFLMIVLIGIVLLPAVIITDVVLTIIGTIKANEGVAYRYPFALRLIK